MARRNTTSLQKVLVQVLQQTLLKKGKGSRGPKTILGVILVVIFAALLALVNPPEESSSNRSENNAATVWGWVEVERFVDGDTIVIEGNVKIRFIGADTPETKKPNWPVEPFGPEAAAFTKRTIEEKSGNRVRLEPDGDQTDRYGRQLALVYLENDVLLNELLIREGLALAKVNYRFSKEMKDRFQQAQYEAQKARRGIWSLPEK